MKYYCYGCENRCSVSVLAGIVPISCVVDPNRDCSWSKTMPTDIKDGRSSRLNICMKEDANGRMVERIDPHDPWNSVVYRSINEASISTGINKGSIARAVSPEHNGKLRAGGYYWVRHIPTMDEMKIKEAAHHRDIEAYKKALLEYDPKRYEYVFGGDE